MSVIRREQRYARAHPCPICGQYPNDPRGDCHGFLSEDGEWATCDKDHGDGAMLIEKGIKPTFRYRRNESGIGYRPWTPEKPTPINAARRNSAPSNKTHATDPGITIFAYADRQRIKRTDFTNAEGEPDKRCIPEHLVGGRWQTGDGPEGVEYIYRRQEVLERCDEPLHVFEGETCADAGAALGLRAITWRGGTGRVSKALEPLTALCSGEHVILHTDADQPGRKAMRKIAAAIAPVAASVRIVDYFPNENPERGGRDIQDRLAEGGNADDLMQLIADATEYDPDGESDEEPAPRSAWDRFKERAVNLADIIENGIEPVEPFDAEEPDLLVGCVTCIIGGPEQGKTTIAAHKIIRALRADKRVLLIDEEMGVRLTAERLDAMGATRDDLSRLIYFPFTLADFGGNLEAMAATITEGIIRESVDLIVMDSVSELIAAAGMDENSNSDATRLLGAWITPAAHVHGRTVLLLDHTTKVEDDGKYGRGAGSKLADVDVQFHIQAAVPPTRTSMGRLVLSRKKDRLASVPATINYLAGGDGTGALNVRIEGSDATTAVKMPTSDRAVLIALYGERNTALRFPEWLAASGRKKSTFADSRRRLVNTGLVEQRDDLYHVSATGIEAIKEDLNAAASTPQQAPLPHTENVDLSTNGGTVAKSFGGDEQASSPAAAAPREGVAGTDASRSGQPLPDKGKEVGTDQYGNGTGVPIRTTQNGGAAVGTDGTDPLKGPYRPYQPPDAPDFDEEEVFDTAVRRESKADDDADDETDLQRLWEWIVAVKGEREFGMPDAVCVAAVRLGCALDSFASAEDEAARLADYLDRHAAMKGGR